MNKPAAIGYGLFGPSLSVLQRTIVKPVPTGKEEHSAFAEPYVHALLRKLEALREEMREREQIRELLAVLKGRGLRIELLIWGKKGQVNGKQMLVLFPGRESK